MCTCRLRASKRASRSLQAVRARRSKLQSTLLALKATFKQHRQQLDDQQQQLDTGATKLRKLQQERDSLQAKLAVTEARIPDLQAKLARAESLMPRLEERCSCLGLEKRKLQGQVTELLDQVAALEDRIKVSRQSDQTWMVQCCGVL